MKIGLIDVDSLIPNLALMKLSAWHKKQGDEVFLMKNTNITLEWFNFDKIYISCIFEQNKKIAVNLASQFKNASVGGVGVNSITLPNEIEHVMPDYDLYKDQKDYKPRSYGFTTRGCIRFCSFCKVPKHEGMIRENCDIYEFWDKRHKELVIMDNNILALPEHFKKIAQQIKDNNLKVDFNQGLDHRLLTPELCKILLELRHTTQIRFAFDDIAYKPTVVRALDMLRTEGLKDWKTRWYMYIGEKDTFETAYERMMILKEYKQDVYVMRDKKVYRKPEYMALSCWGNAVGAFKTATFKEVLESSDRMKQFKRIFKDRFKLTNTEEIKKKERGEDKNNNTLDKFGLL